MAILSAKVPSLDCQDASSIFGNFFACSVNVLGLGIFKTLRSNLLDC